ncbi:hypothetical protein VE00_02853 [Pseudogymnoascus sp. WSF 3629]|nr:hypothetical protein VE00_02853 [Pseudogymnoascus sp. WSF 3629]
MTDQFTESNAPYTSGTPLLTLNDVGDEGPLVKKQKLNPSSRNATTRTSNAPKLGSSSSAAGPSKPASHHTNMRSNADVLLIASLHSQLDDRDEMR